MAIAPDQIGRDQTTGNQVTGSLNIASLNTGNLSTANLSISNNRPTAIRVKVVRQLGAGSAVVDAVAGRVVGEASGNNA